MGASSAVFHHIGRPVPVEEISGHPDMRYTALYDMYTLDLANDLSLHIQLHAFGPASTLHEDIQRLSHVAFKVEDIESVLVGKDILMPLYEPFAGFRCAMVRLNHQLIELVQTDLPEEAIWGGEVLKGGVLYPES